MTTTVKRACDACHRRKVKCNGINPCRNCSTSQLTCTYNAIPQKKGPKGSRAKVISELRETQRVTSITAKAHSRINGIQSPPASPHLAPTPGLLAGDMIKDCLEFYFNHMYPTMPILHRQRLEQQAMFADQNLDTYCLLTSLCAFMTLQPGTPVSSADPYAFDSMPGTNIISSTLLMEETIRVRKAYDYVESPTLNSLCTSYFLFCYFNSLDMHEKAWYHLREATTLAHMAGLDNEDTYAKFDVVDATSRRRLYWLLFVAERAYALQRQRPLTLQATINPPTSEADSSDPAAHQIGAFLHLVDLFRPLDNSLVSVWTKTRRECPQAFLSSLQKQLQEVLPPYLSESQAQLAEMPINLQWLKSMAWQMSVAMGSGGDDDVAMSFPHPIDIARDLLPVVSVFPGNLGVTGLSLAEKLFTMTGSLIEYLAGQPASRDPFSMGPREHLHQILNVVGALRGGDHRFLPLLLSRVNDALPRLANPMLQNVPETACSIDIFDGFGNGGMAHPPPPVFSHDDFKFPLSSMEELANDSRSTNGSAGGSSQNEISSSPFASSPALVSPGLEISRGLSSDFPTSMPDVIMTSMTHARPHPPGMNGHAPPPNHHRVSVSGYPQGVNPAFQNLNLGMGGQGPGMSMPTHNLNGPIRLHTNGTLFPQPPKMLIKTEDSPQVTARMPSPLGQPSLSSGGIMSRSPAQRANSFAMPTAQPQPPQQQQQQQREHVRPVPDFGSVQGSASDLGALNQLGMGSMGLEMDISGLRPRHS